MVTVDVMGYASPCDELQSHSPTYFTDVSMEELNATTSLMSRTAHGKRQKIELGAGAIFSLERIQKISAYDRSGKRDFFFQEEKERHLIL